ncbi:ABC transporter permease [Chitinophaga barathri]|uniref:FtsX-like permease family protein n=1 Tax=Chitinophaga barathri TaxID=1647451 RepID=A0A3N4MDL5_9BACT|nr:ABC transporter permease [Chitinophaga barathri]RPD39687.1 FtsX-like permease family protein [Chitinophaga barathri]
MIRNYLLLAYRNIVRHKLFTAINLIGLAMSMSLCMMVILHVADFLSYDRFHPHGGRIYRLLTEMRNPEGKEFLLASSPLPLKDAIRGDSTLVEDAVNLYPALKGTARIGDRSLPLYGAFTTPSFFKVFGFRLAKGNETTALLQPNGIILSHEAAQRYFGNADAMGKTLEIDPLGAFQVTGVLEQRTDKSHIEFEAYAPAIAVPQLEKNKLLPEKTNSWNTVSEAYTYVLLQPAAGKAQLQSSLDRLAKTLFNDPKQGSISFPVQPLSHITPSWEETYNNIGSGQSWGKVFAEIGLGLIILISACFNYTNLSIARSLSRAKEVGIRKVAGASRFQVFGQYIMEAVIITFLALGLGYIMLTAAQHRNLFNANTGVVNELLQWKMLLAFVTFSVLTGLLAGTLPAWILSAFNPAEVLKRLPSHRVFGKMGLRRSLLVFQLALSLIITVFLFAFYRQFSYMADANKGYQPEGVLTIKLQGNPDHLVRQEVAALSGVEAVSGASYDFKKYLGSRLSVKSSVSKEPAAMDYYSADENFLDVMGLRLAAGQNFRAGQTGQLLINEKAAISLGFKDAASAAGQPVQVNDTVSATVAGVLKDFNYQHLGQPIRPMAIVANGGDYSLLQVKVKTADHDQFQRKVTAIWAKLYPGEPVQAEWLAEELYRNQKQGDSISFLGYISIMTVLIAVMGLLAMVIYSTALRKKEIGVRKVMGADVKSLVLLLSRGFLKMILIAGCIALPLGWLASNFFLNSFPYRINFGWGSVMACFLAVLAICLLAIASQTWRAASADPTDSLRND